MAEVRLFPWAEKLVSAVAAISSEIQADMAGPRKDVRSPAPQAEETDLESSECTQKTGTPNLIPEKEEMEEVVDMDEEEDEASPVIEVPRGLIQREPKETEDNDWEVLSANFSHQSTTGVMVPKAGSVRSITSIEHDHSTSSHTTLSVPFKIQRTLSSSTIDSQDNALGPSGKGVLGVDYVEHVVLPTDTLQGICIAYKVSVASLRRANHFSGQLHSAPKKLLIPLSKQALRTGYIRVQDTDTKEFKLSFFQAEYPDSSQTEARAYLELADWDLKEALKSLKEDREWQKDDMSPDDLKAGQIGIKVDFKNGAPQLSLKGAGKSTDTSSSITESRQKVEVHRMAPAIESKSVLPEDLCNAAPQHGTVGVELKTLSKHT
ncbi:unnamed protein product [Cylindrotheca closterium]|uniref:LysM domain-containing protein n=1 Tax=Cylindrotheca closterium TaxID=2856 RepID=A0AAD2CH15_9STRA|nr:unnamed protein product [Cylindrotheca closterium]